MYDKLGDLLNEALEKGEIPQKKADKAADSDKLENQSKEKTDNIRKNVENKQFFTHKKQIPTGEVIKMHKYTESMHIPPEIVNALGTLHLVYPVDWKIVKKQYHTLLKSVHPDTKTTIQSSLSVQNNIQQTVDDLKQAYALLKAWYKK